ncbi:hypothetical protein PI124_g15916 [Phytophthora idaei]|nr:hypothetical protein PI126_g14297 [Phytophthora idaei]KAG3239151.1 hypothetical protein PI124_g15916 [Phytophthora idaei]
MLTSMSSWSSLAAPFSKGLSCMGDATERMAVVKVARRAIARLSVTTPRALPDQQSADLLVELMSFASRPSYSTRLALCYEFSWQTSSVMQ